MGSHQFSDLISKKNKATFTPVTFFQVKKEKKKKINLLSETLAGKDRSQAHDSKKRLSSLELVENK